MSLLPCKNAKDTAWSPTLKNVHGPTEKTHINLPPLPFNRSGITLDRDQNKTKRDKVRVYSQKRLYCVLQIWAKNEIINFI